MPVTSSTAAAAYAITILHCLLLLSPSSTALIKNFNFTADDRPLILIDNFAFAQSGHINISVSNIASSSLNPSQQLGFLLMSKHSIHLVLSEIQQNPFFCILDSNHINLLFTLLRNLSHSHSNFNITSPNEYNLFFVNCDSRQSQVTMEVHTEIYSVDLAGVKSYLSAGLTQLPTIMSMFSLTYFMFLVFWICFIFLTNKQSSVHRIHHLMSLLLLIKSLNLISSAADNQNMKITGTPNIWLHNMFYIFQFVEVVLLYTVIILLATGNCFHLLIVIPLQVLASFAFVMIGEGGPFMKNWVIWNQCFLIVDMMWCCLIILALVRSIRSLRKEGSKTDGKAAAAAAAVIKKRLSKLTLFSLVYVGYVCFTRIGVLVLVAMIIETYKYEWVNYVAKEMANLAFYIIMFYIFRPVDLKDTV